jgi:hypothetical protein
MRSIIEELDAEVLTADTRFKIMCSGHEGFIELRSAVEAGILNQRQLSNGLEMLPEMLTNSCFHDRTDMLDMLSKLASHHSQNVRTEAVLQSLQLVELSEKFPRFTIDPFSRDSIALRLRDALEKGLDDKARVKLLNFLAHNPNGAA